MFNLILIFYMGNAPIPFATMRKINWKAKKGESLDKQSGPYTLELADGSCTKLHKLCVMRYSNEKVKKCVVNSSYKAATENAQCKCRNGRGRVIHRTIRDMRQKLFFRQNNFKWIQRVIHSHRCINLSVVVIAFLIGMPRFIPPFSRLIGHKFSEKKM